MSAGIFSSCAALAAVMLGTAQAEPPAPRAAAKPIAVMRHGAMEFRVYPGGCLRGPLVITDASGRRLFEIGPRVWWPAGCEATQ